MSSSDTNDATTNTRHPSGDARPPDPSDAADRPDARLAISDRIQQISHDVLQVNQGSLYPALHRLEHRGWIEAEWGVSELGRRAKFYKLDRSLAAASSRSRPASGKHEHGHRPCDHDGVAIGSGGDGVTGAPRRHGDGRRRTEAPDRLDQREEQDRRFATVRRLARTTQQCPVASPAERPARPASVRLR